MIGPPNVEIIGGCRLVAKIRRESEFRGGGGGGGGGGEGEGGFSSDDIHLWCGEVGGRGGGGWGKEATVPSFRVKIAVAKLINLEPSSRFVRDFTLC